MLQVDLHLRGHYLLLEHFGKAEHSRVLSLSPCISSLRFEEVLQFREVLHIVCDWVQLCVLLASLRSVVVIHVYHSLHMLFIFLILRDLLYEPSLVRLIGQLESLLVNIGIRQVKCSPTPHEDELLIFLDLLPYIEPASEHIYQFRGIRGQLNRPEELFA